MEKISKQRKRKPGRIPGPTQPGGTAYIPQGPQAVQKKPKAVEKKPGASTRPKPGGPVKPKPIKKRGR